MRCVPATPVESLYVALKSIDRMDIVNMLEGQPPQTQGRQGSRELNRARRPSEREQVSPGMTNGKTQAQNPKVQTNPSARA